MWPSSTTDLHLRARLAQGNGRDVLIYSQILTVEVQVHCQGSHVKFLAASVALRMSHFQKFRFSLSSFHQCSTFVLWPPSAWKIRTLEPANTEIRLLVERPEFESSRGKKIFPLRYIQSGSGAQPASYSKGPELFPEHDVDHSPPSNAKLKNEWRYTPTAIIQHHVVDGDSVAIFTFTYLLTPWLRS